MTKYLYNVEQSVVLTLRSVFQVICCQIIADIYQIEISLKNSHNFKILVKRSIITVFQQTSLFYFITKLPTSLVVMLQSTGTTMVFLLNFILYKKPLQMMEIIGSMVVMVGVVFIVNPSLVLGQEITNFLSPAHHTRPQTNHYQYSEGSMKIVMMIGVLCSQAAWAYCIVIFNQTKGIHSNTLNYYTGIFILLGNVFPVRFLGGGEQTLTFNLTFSDYFMILVGTGLTNFLAAACFFQSIILSKNYGRTMIIQQMQIVESIIIDILIFSDMPSVLQISGAMILISGIALAILKKTPRTEAK